MSPKACKHTSDDGAIFIGIVYYDRVDCLLCYLPDRRQIIFEEISYVSTDGRFIVSVPEFERKFVVLVNKSGSVLSSDDVTLLTIGIHKFCKAFLGFAPTKH